MPMELLNQQREIHFSWSFRTVNSGQIKMLPNMVLDQILDAADLFPPEIVKKVRKARGK